MYTKKIYTAGRMTGIPFEEQMKWRQELEETLRHYDFWFSIFHPPLFYNMTNFQTDQEVMEYDIAQLSESDIMVVNLKDISKSIGTIMELATAYSINHSGKKHIFVVGIGNKEEMHPWIRCCVQRFEPDVASASCYISQFLNPYK